jgi:hypothetical protein
MRRLLAEVFNGLGSSIDKSKPSMAKKFYKFAAAIDSRWSSPWYNLGWQAKNT